MLRRRGTVGSAVLASAGGGSRKASVSSSQLSCRPPAVESGSDRAGVHDRFVRGANLPVMRGRYRGVRTAIAKLPRWRCPVRPTGGNERAAAVRKHHQQQQCAATLEVQHNRQRPALKRMPLSQDRHCSRNVAEMGSVWRSFDTVTMMAYALPGTSYRGQAAPAPDPQMAESGRAGGRAS